MGSIIRAIKRNRTKEAKIMKPDPGLMAQLNELRATVDNFNRLPKLAFRGGTYKGMSPTSVYTTKNNGFVFGYQLVDLGPVVQRTVYVKCEQPLREVPEEEWFPVLTTAFEALLDEGAEYPEMEMISPFCLRMRQKFATLHLVETQPGIVTPGRA